MPLFGSKFSPKKTPPRKNGGNSINPDELYLDQRVIKLKLNDHEVLFDNGDWIPESGKSGNTYKTNQKLRRKISELQEENNLLRIKYEVILNMLTQVTAESQSQEKEIERLKKRHK